MRFVCKLERLWVCYVTSGLSLAYGYKLSDVFVQFPLYSYGLHIDRILPQHYLSLFISQKTGIALIIKASFVYVLLGTSGCLYQGVLLSYLRLLTRTLMQILFFTKFIQKIFVLPTFQFRLIGSMWNKAHL